MLFFKASWSWKWTALNFWAALSFDLQACRLYSLRVQWLEASTLSAPLNHLYGLNKWVHKSDASCIDFFLSWDRWWGMGSLGFDLSALAPLKIKQRKTGEESSPCWLETWLCLTFILAVGGGGNFLVILQVYCVHIEQDVVEIPCDTFLYPYTNEQMLSSANQIDRFQQKNVLVCWQTFKFLLYAPQLGKGK